ncbi:MAG: hypothetical protein ACHQCF_06900, partial [Solirubrobacterales bacterium]
GATPTAVLGSQTATRRLEDAGRTEFRPAQSQTRRPAPRAPERVAVPAPLAAPPPVRKRSAFSRFVRFILALVALVLIAAAVAAAVILTTDKASGVHATEVAGHTIGKVVEQFEELVKNNTK